MSEIMTIIYEEVDEIVFVALLVISFIVLIEIVRWEKLNIKNVSIILAVFIILNTPGCLYVIKDGEKAAMELAALKSQEDYYNNILEVKNGATEEEIRQAYYRLHTKYTLDSMRHGEWSFLRGTSNLAEERKASRGLKDIEEAYKELMKQFDDEES